MGKENGLDSISNQRLLVKRNGEISRSFKGELYSELWRVSTQLKKHSEGTYGANETIIANLVDRKEELCKTLHLPESEVIRRRKINNAGKTLANAGLPPWRLIK